MPLIDFSHKPTGWLKRMLKAPTYLYQARLGILFGYRFVMIEHRGRNTGTRHFTVARWPGTCRGNGCALQEPDLVPTGIAISKRAASRRSGSGRGGRASVRFLDEMEAAGVMGAYERAHPKMAAKLYSMMGVSYDGTDEGRVEMMAKIPMVAFSPRDVHTRGAAFL